MLVDIAMGVLFNKMLCKMVHHCRSRVSSSVCHMLMCSFNVVILFKCEAKNQRAIRVFTDQVIPYLVFVDVFKQTQSKLLMLFIKLKSVNCSIVSKQFFISEEAMIR